jgi:ribonuclease HI
MEITIYCDGAVAGNGGPGKMGMAAVLLLMEDGKVKTERARSWRMESTYATNIQAELWAVSYGIDEIKPSHRPNVDLRIITDSEWVVKAVTGVYKKVSAYPDLIAEIRTQMSKFHNAKLEWVRGHAGDTFNEKANELAQREAGTWKGK